MQMALYEPGLGYYSAGLARFDETGDFMTAPEISSVFSKCVARQCEQILNNLSNACILELGPGSGRMACDILLELKELDCLPEKYYLLETSEILCDRQKRLFSNTVPELMEYTEWIKEVPEAGVTGLILANEVIDAMPVHRVRINGLNYYECCVDFKGNNFCWSDITACPSLVNTLEQLLDTLPFDLPDNYLTEINLLLPDWLGSLSDTLIKGAILFIDYGYSRNDFFHPQRKNGTLLCHYRHRLHDDPFFYPGLQDITSSVDFTRIAECADESGLQVNGYSTQGHFLLGCGIEKFAGRGIQDNVIDSLKLSQQIKKLTMPGEMGERFKVMSLTRDLPLDLIGHQFNDMRNRL